MEEAADSLIEGLAGAKGFGLADGLNASPVTEPYVSELYIFTLSCSSRPAIRNCAGS